MDNWEIVSVNDSLIGMTLVNVKQSWFVFSVLNLL
jgi:hypothetical protein